VRKFNFFLKVLLITFLNLIIVIVVLFLTFKNPTFLKLENVKIDSFSNDSIVVKSNAVFVNKNIYSINGRNISIDTYYKDSMIAKSNIKTLNLKSNQKSISENIVYLSTKQLSDKWNGFIEKDSIKLKSVIEGDFGPFNFKYKTNFNYSIPSRLFIKKFIDKAVKRQSFKIQNFRLEKLGLKEWLWNFDIQIFNQNPFDLVLKKINVKVFAEKDEKNEVGSWNYNSSEIILTEGDKKMISGQFKTTLGGTISTFLSKINDPNLIFYVNSKIEVVINNQIFKIPYKLKVKIDPFTRKISIIK
tara:strand:+ start:1025 stop:1927 length:903 start_codon:yes stop_codon:yes gene_type:complete